LTALARPLNLDWEMNFLSCMHDIYAWNAYFLYIWFFFSFYFPIDIIWAGRVRLALWKKRKAQDHCFSGGNMGIKTERHHMTMSFGFGFFGV
jgi:hypothetical protein